MQTQALLHICKEESETFGGPLLSMHGPCERMTVTADFTWTFFTFVIQVTCKCMDSLEALWIKQKGPCCTLKFRKDKYVDLQRRSQPESLGGGTRV